MPNPKGALENLKHVKKGQVLNPNGYNQYKNREGVTMSEDMRACLRDNRKRKRLLENLLGIAGQDCRDSPKMQAQALKALALIFDRTEGKPTQQVEVKTEGTINICLGRTPALKGEPSVIDVVTKGVEGEDKD